MLNVIRLLICLSLLLLQACQPKNIVLEEKALRLQKQQQAALYNTQLGLGYLRQEDRTRAKRKLLRALDLAPNSADVNAAMAYYLERTGDLTEADHYYKKALLLAPKNGVQFNNYGGFLCRHGHYKKAENYFLNAVKDVQYIHTSGAYENAGLCVAAIPDYTKAKYYFIKALEQDPKRKQSLYELVKIELKQHHGAEALTYLQHYPRLTLNDPALLILAVKASHRIPNLRAEEEYKLRLNHLNKS